MLKAELQGFSPGHAVERYRVRLWQVREEEAFSGLSPSRPVVPPSGSPSTGAWRKGLGWGAHQSDPADAGPGFSYMFIMGGFSPEPHISLAQPSLWTPAREPGL